MTSEAYKKLLEKKKLVEQLAREGKLLYRCPNLACPFETMSQEEMVAHECTIISSN